MPAIATRPRLVFNKGNDEASGEIEYRQKRYSKVGKYWSHGNLSPSGRWLAVFSYNGEKPPPDFFHFISGADPRKGEVTLRRIGVGAPNAVLLPGLLRVCSEQFS